ncbi:N,N-dimethylformamidase beta subunit family domain-containing protein [Kribbella sp. NPDC051137]|uniref:N,N-dimethylformamidase beta subunit family domain-containing protein n=1 Tax=Kribbella sp. NPDC051137 TaxID=3155045 RepID=UPI0034141CCA
MNIADLARRRGGAQLTRRLVAAALAVLVVPAAFTVTLEPAALAAAGPTAAAVTAANGTTTLTYRAAATRAGRLRYIVVSIPPGSAGSITTINGSIRAVARGVLLWRPRTATTVAAGTRLTVPLYGVRLPADGPWRLSFRATSTTGSVLSSGRPVLVRPANVRVTATNPVPGRRTTLTYAGTIGRAGTVSSVRMKLPTGAKGTMRSVNGALRVSGGYATWTPRRRLTVRGGTRLAIPVYGVALSRTAGIMRLAMAVRGSSGAVLMAGTASLAVVTPPAAMPTIPAGSFPAIPAGCPSAWPTTSAENAKPGTADWVIPARMNGRLAAYLTKVSVSCGGTVDLKVTSGRPVSVVAYRMGYYRGLGGREIWRRDRVRTVVQPAPTIGGTANGHPLRMASAANWSKTLTLRVDRNWVPGTYLIKISDGRYASYAPLTVRDDTRHKHALLIQQASTTWEAYNWYGGRSFYSSAKTGSGRLTFDRPYAEGQGSGEFLPLEQGLIVWAESRGLDVTYWTDNDLDVYGGQLAARARTVFLPGHDEYYSLRMRASLSQAIKRGVNVASFGANAVYRRITFTSSTRRAWDVDRYTAGGNSTLWRHLGDGYASQPLLGAEYSCGVSAGNLRTGRSWLFHGIPAGTVVPGFLAGEVDRLWPDLYRPRHLGVLASGSAICRSTHRSTPMNVTAFVAPSGARVFNGSTFTYGCFLVRRCPSNLRVPVPSVASRRVVTTMVTNVANWVSRGALATSASASAPALTVTVPDAQLPTDGD